MLTLISSIFATIISGILFLVAENDPNAWKLNSKTELIAVTCFVSEENNISYMHVI